MEPVITQQSKIAARISNIASGKIKLIPFPWPKLSEASNALLPGTVTLLCGSPGGSKSFLLLQALMYWWDTDIPVSIFELEEDREYHLMRLLSQKTGIAGLTNYNWIVDNPHMAEGAVDLHTDFLALASNSIFVCPPKPPSFSEVAYWIEQQAKIGKRVICVDPITAAIAMTGKSWSEESEFIQQIKRVASSYGCSIVLVTHPKGKSKDMDLFSLAGSQCFPRFTQTIFWLQSHLPKESYVSMDTGTAEVEYNRTLHLLKTRNSHGVGLKIAFTFDKETFMLKEHGIIIKKKQEK